MVEPQGLRRPNISGWLQQITPQLRGISRLIVLGCGTGEHLVQLVAIFPPSKILVIDKNVESLRECRKRFALEMTEVQFLALRSPNDVFARAGIKSNNLIFNFIKHSYTIVRFLPATAYDPAFYDEIEGLISGRTQTSFAALLKCRPEFSPLFDREPELSRVHQISQERISIKNIMAALSPQAEQSEALLIRALGELIA